MVLTSAVAVVVAVRFRDWMAGEMDGNGCSVTLTIVAERRLRDTLE